MIENPDAGIGRNRFRMRDPQSDRPCLMGPGHCRPADMPPPRHVPPEPPGARGRHADSRRHRVSVETQTQVLRSVRAWLAGATASWALSSDVRAQCLRLHLPSRHQTPFPLVRPCSPGPVLSFPHRALSKGWQCILWRGWDGVSGVTRTG